MLAMPSDPSNPPRAQSSKINPWALSFIFIFKKKRELEDIQSRRGTIVLYWREHGNGDVQLSHLYMQIGLSTNADVPLPDFMAALSPFYRPSHGTGV